MKQNMNQLIMYRKVDYTRKRSLIMSHCWQQMV